MANPLKKRGQKLARNFSRFSRRASKNSLTRIETNLISRASHVAEVRLYILEWFLLVSAVILLAITQLNWYSDAYSVTTFESGGTFTEATLGKVSTLNPLLASTDSEKSLSRLLFSSLAEDDYTGHIGLGLAKSITPDSTGKIWTVKLREGLTWSDGEPITAEDVLFTANLIKDPSFSTTYSSRLSGVSVSIETQTEISSESSESSELSTASSIVFTLPTPYSDFTTALTFPIVPQHILSDTPISSLAESDFSKHPIGSGPFIFNASQVIGTSGEVSIILTANDRYFRGRPLLDSFTIHAFLDKQGIISALNSGAVTATPALSLTDIGNITSPNIYHRNIPVSSGVFAFFNTASTSLRSTSVRSAIRRGINIRAIREVINTENPLDYPILSSQISLKSWPEIPSYDPEAARASLEELEVAPNTHLTIATISESNLPLVAEAFAGDLRDLGYDVTVTSFESSQDFITNVIRNRAYDILIYNVELGVDPDLLAYYHSSQATTSGLNLSNLKNTYIDDLILASRTTLDSTVRSTKYESFLQYWLDETPAIALYQSTFPYFYNKNARIFSESNILAYPTDRYTDVIYWASEKTTKNRTP